METSKIELTGFAGQFKRLKEMNKNAIIFLYMGHFYNLLGIDALIGHELLGLRVGVRSIGDGRNVPNVGMPITTGLNYARQFCDLGFRVVIVDQVPGIEEDGLVKRVVTDVLEPAINVIDIRTEYGGKYRRYMDGEFKRLVEIKQTRSKQRQIEAKAFKIASAKQGFDFEAALLALNLEELTPLEAHKQLVEWKMKVLRPGK